MTILPLRTAPWTRRIDRTHRPRAASGRYGYRAYRRCLRWEFGFSCAFCLLHEADLSEHGTEGTGLTSVEHFSPVSTEAGATNVYENCFYCCRFCNGSRAAQPVRDRGRQLLDPCRHIWADHFFLSDDDRLLPRAGDRDADYTAAVYDLNEPRKVAMRRLRRERLAEWTSLLSEGPELIDELLRSVAQEPRSSRTAARLQAAEKLRRCMTLAAQELERYRVIPADVPNRCRCRPAVPLTLPAAWGG
jgi:hypothetical protein